MTMSDEPKNFLNLPPEHTGRASRYAVLPVPYEGTVSYLPGTAEGPAAILSASAQVEYFDEELGGEFIEAGVMTCPMLEPASGPEEQMRRVREAAGAIVAEGKFLLTLGGEHSISTPLVELQAERHGEISVLQIDAHADLRDEYRGSRFSHACVMRRVLEITGSLCQVGIRSYSSQEARQCPEQVGKFFTPPLIASQEDWIGRVVASLRENVYVTVDIDGFDPAFAPGTGTPEPGGLDWRQVTGLLRRVCRERQVVAADIVEVRPIPPSHITEYLAARLAYKIIAYTQQA
jgi:agmatinase